MRRLGLFALLVGLGGCGSGSDVLYVGSALPGPFDSVCLPAVVFQPIDPAASSAFLAVAPDPGKFVRGLSINVCPLLYRATSEVPNVPTVTLGVGPTNGDGSADATTDTIVIDSATLVAFASAHTVDDTRYEEAGLTTHLLSHLYQHLLAPLGVLSGINDFVRFRTGYLSEADRRKGGNWDDGQQTTGFFFAYVDGRYPNFVYELNRMLAVGYDPSIFVTHTGKDVLTLWSDYQQSF